MSISNKDFNLAVDTAIFILRMVAISGVVKLAVDYFNNSLKYKESEL